ncbi:MAG TPA: hypothetical protein VEJ63_05915 [Planctomycetota bacterium]|nr:hypothetical protein [Planctomycetota bacterium]
MLNYFDPLLQGMSTALGLGLVGLLVLRTNARGKVKILGLEHGPLFQPTMQKTGRLLTIAFVVCVALVMLRWGVAAVAA